MRRARAACRTASSRSPISPTRDVEAVLEQHCGHANMRGIRYILNYEAGEPLYCAAERGDWLRDPQWRSGFALLGRYGLSFDLQIFWQQMADARDLARAFPDTQIILNHTGMPRKREPDYVEAWRNGMRTLAAAPNVAAKISGLSMFHHDWTPALIRPFVLDTIEIFGAGRCMFASNFPVDRLHAEYRAIWQAFDGITAELLRVRAPCAVPRQRGEALSDLKPLAVRPRPGADFPPPNHALVPPCPCRCITPRFRSSFSF